MNSHRDSLRQRLGGWAGWALSAALIGVAAVLVGIALLAPAWVRAGALAWTLLP